MSVVYSSSSLAWAAPRYVNEVVMAVRCRKNTIVDVRKIDHVSSGKLHVDQVDVSRPALAMSSSLVSASHTSAAKTPSVV